jgi:hypothetical protein
LKHLRPRLTYANVMSTLAVFLVLGGATAVAASHLGKNSVGTKQLKKSSVTAAKIKKNAVTTAKIKNNAVTGAKVNEASLKTVPSAEVANSLSPLEPTHIVGNSGEPSFENGSHNVGGLGGAHFNAVGFYKDHDGIVHLQGVAETGKNGGIGLTPVFTLPPGFRPAPGTIVIQAPAGLGVYIGGSDTTVSEGVTIDLSGKVSGTEEESLVVLDGASFRAES